MGIVSQPFFIQTISQNLVAHRDTFVRITYDVMAHKSSEH